VAPMVGATVTPLRRGFPAGFGVVCRRRCGLSTLYRMRRSKMPAYIKMPGIKGESDEQSHKEWVYVESLSLPIHRSIQNGATGVQRSNGETSLGDIVIVKTWDSSTPNLASACANGKYMDEVIVHLCSTINNKNVVNLEVKLKDCIISSYSFHGTGDQSPVPSESITLNYTTIEWCYNKYDTKGNKASNFPAKYSTQEAKS
jgi:type VI secretion system secreted protein Hcp